MRPRAAALRRRGHLRAAVHGAGLTATAAEAAAPIGRLLGTCALAVAASFTGGLVTHALVAAEGSGEWLRGGVVAYDAEVKYRLLGVPRGPVVNARAAEMMARGVAELLGADVGLATTGVAGPEAVEGQPAGTTWIGVATPEVVLAEHFALHGSPAEISDTGARRALELLAVVLDRPGPTPPASPARDGVSS